MVLATTVLRPFFTYYGGKYRAAIHYPAPRHRTVYEPFAGAAGYGLRYFQRRVRLYDLNPVVAGVWDYLIHVSPAEVLRLPARVSHTDEVQAPPEARALIGFCLSKATASPRKSPSRWVRECPPGRAEVWGEARRALIARQVELIRHWQVRCSSYEDAPDEAATWFVDAPYAGSAGRHYPYHSIDFAALAEWSQSRRGQVIVCEREGADWLPFRPFRTVKALEGRNGKRVSREVVWCS